MWFSTCMLRLGEFYAGLAGTESTTGVRFEAETHDSRGGMSGAGNSGVMFPRVPTEAKRSTVEPSY